MVDDGALGRRPYSRKAIDWSGRLPAIARGAALLKAKSFTIDGEAVVIGPNGLTDFEARHRYPPPVSPSASVPLSPAVAGSFIDPLRTSQLC
jgi:hypothetical protein